MKTIIFYGLLVFGFANVFTQHDTEAHTKSIKIENFISYIAAQDTAPKEQQIYLAIEIGSD